MITIAIILGIVLLSSTVGFSGQTTVVYHESPFTRLSWMFQMAIGVLVLAFLLDPFATAGFVNSILSLIIK